MSDTEVPPDSEALADLADAILVIARRLSMRGHDLRDVMPLTGTEIVVIREVMRSARISPAELAAASGLKRSNVSTAIRSLEGRGLLERRQKAGNDRSIELVMTQQAEENFHRVRMVWAGRLRNIPSGLINESLSALNTLNALASHLADITPLLELNESDTDRGPVVL